LPLQLHLIDHRYQIPQLQQHMRTQLPDIDLQFVTPGNHAQYLQALSQLHAVLDTWPYSGGLTTLEAHSLGVPVYTQSQGQLFCERHSHAHQQLLGMHHPSINAPDFLPSHALQIDRHKLRLHAARRQDVRHLVERFRQILSLG
jgi:predicted O-linked N-acetylglucosamine transferase (SPINDLY family)